MFKMASVIIPALNEEENIGRCVAALKEIDMPDVDMGLEIIVVDNGSQDRTVEIARGLGATVYVQPDLTIGGVRNYGAARSRGDILAFVDADCVVSKSWLTRAAGTIGRESADMVGSFHDIPDEFSWVARTAKLVDNTKTGTDVQFIPSGNMIVKRSSFDAVGGFTETLETSEDVDLCHKLKQSGFKLFLDPGIRSVHLRARKGIGDLIKKEMWYGKNMCSVFLSDLRTRKLKSVRNLRLVTYSCVNLTLMLGIIASMYPLYGGNPVPLAICLVLYILLNLTVALNEWRKIKKNLPQLFAYSVIYGVARSMSIVKWLATGASGSHDNAA